MASGRIYPYQGKRGTTYRVRLDLGIDPQTNRPNQPVTTFSTREEAELFLAQWELDQKRGIAIDPSKLTMGDLLVEWLTTKAVKPSTLEDYEAMVRLHIKPYFNTIRVQKLTTTDVDRYIAERRRACTSDRILRECRLHLSQALDYALQRGLVARNVVKAAVKVKPTRKEMQVWQPEEVRRFLEVAQESTYHPIWHVALLTGMRRGELLGLRWQDVDLQRGTLAIRQAVGPVKNRPLAQTPKSGRARLIELDMETVEQLRGHRKRQNEARLAAGAAYHKHDYVFASEAGTSINPPNLHREFTALRRKAGVSRIRIHDLRHTAATLMLTAGVPVKVVSQRLGHASVTITLDLYVHVLPGLDRAAAETLWQAIVAPESQKFSQTFAK